MENERSGKDRKSDSRTRRLADELRENLRRRKAQERGRKPPPAGEGAKRTDLPPRGG
jgi:hypothetical protein